MHPDQKRFEVTYDGTSDNKPVSVVDYVESGNVTSEELFN